MDKREEQGLVRDVVQFLRLEEAKLLFIIDEDVRQSLAESIAALVLAVAEHSRAVQK